MKDNRSCKGCDDSYRVMEEQISRMLLSPMFQSPERCVPEPVYEKRLEACMDCPNLLEGTTCSLCGCIVRITAKLKERSCPKPGDNRWTY
ncbi:DUF6171 family protein [Paenibacillus abyssi]|uniref:Uncharacterized protein n=1 Tax=Paenibacillus abyssi TaxID=1340531 RepID=A0A917FRJ4_9BACL|nr:DUF6171 family protein [Paenibacillus abyssi]GGF97942.1 hypothetical protein GCM10010916_13980 [Paenibacillus abyssi]